MPWPALAAPFGADYGDRNFDTKFLAALRHALLLYPSAPVEQAAAAAAQAAPSQVRRQLE